MAGHFRQTSHRLDSLERSANSGRKIYANTTALALAFLNQPPPIGTTVQVGTIAGTGTAMPRYYLWTGSVWAPIGWWASAGRIGCSIYSASRAIGAGATDVTVYANEVFDYDNGHAANATTFAVQVAGIYAVTAQEVLSTSTSGVLAVALTVNGGAVYGNAGPAPFGLAGSSLTSAFTVGQTIGVNVYSSVALSHTSYLHVTWLGP
jgi:hypothetical protein